MTPSMIPMIDIAALEGGSTAEKEAVGRHLDDACRRVGFFYVAGHGVDPASIDAAFAAARSFFHLPIEQRLELRSHSPYRGFHPLATDIPSAVLEDVTVAKTPIDYREHFHVGRDGPAMEGDPFTGPNTWPPSVPHFRVTVEAYAQALRGVAERIIRGLAIGLGIGEHGLDAMFRKPYALLDLVHYPPRESGGGGSGIAGHTDYGFLTVLAQDDVGGLEVLIDKAGWFPATPRPGTFICNLGDLITRLTNGVYRATRHRVVSPSGCDRYSLPYFLDPDGEAVVRPLPGFAVAAGGRAFEPIMCRDYLLAIYGRKKLNLDQAQGKRSANTAYA